MKRTDVLQLRVTANMLQRWQGAAKSAQLGIHAWAERALERAAERPDGPKLADLDKLLAKLNDPT